jgi:deazaflavin-dependent oxidoreductase (nitroreductase family)
VSEEFCYLTTRGRRTGRPHTIEIWFASLGTSLYLISGGEDRSDWVRNLGADPAARVRVGDAEFAVRARVPLVEPDERRQAVRLLHDKYRSELYGSLETWQERAFIVALDQTTTNAVDE